MRRGTVLTTRRLRAIQEALVFRLAGEIEGEIPDEDYDRALDWVSEQLNRRRDNTQEDA